MNIEQRRAEMILDPREEKFCYEFLFSKENSANAILSYKAAFGVALPQGIAPEVSYNSIPTLAGKMLSQPHIQAKLKLLLIAKGMTPEYLDLQLLRHIESDNWKESMEAIKEVDRIMGRVQTKQQTVIINANDLLDRIERENLKQSYGVRSTEGETTSGQGVAGAESLQSGG